MLTIYLPVQLVGTGRSEWNELWLVMSAEKGSRLCVEGVGGGGSDIITHDVVWGLPRLEMKSQSISVKGSNE